LGAKVSVFGNQPPNLLLLQQQQSSDAKQNENQRPDFQLIAHL
jgi:hypothetical protein